MPEGWTNVTDPIFHRAARKPKAVAVVEGPAQLTFREFTDLISKCTVYLKQLGIKSGDRVGVRMTSSTDHLILSLALLRIGAAKFELSPMSTPQELEAITRKFGITTLFLEPPMKLYRGARGIAVDLSWRAGLEGLVGDVRHDDAAGEPYYVNLSPGRGGPGKGIVVHHRQTLERLAHYEAALEGTGILSSADPGTYLMFGNMSSAGLHAFMLYQVMSGARTVVLPDFAKFYDIVRHFNYYDDAVAMVLPVLCDVFLSCAQKNVMLLPKMRALVVGGRSVPGEITKAMLAKVTPHFHEVYDVPGAGWVSLLRPQDMARRADTVGKPVPGMEIEVLGAEGEPLGKNRIGRVRCRGASISEDYLLPEDRAQDAEGFDDGWHYPGDLGQIDGSGFLTLKGRVAEIIKRGGVDIIPAEVEAAITSHASVKEASVVAIRGQRGRIRVVGVVVARDKPMHEALVAHCTDKLAVDKRPDALLYAASLPRNAGGKVDRARVTELVLQARRAPAAGRA